MTNPKVSVAPLDIIPLTFFTFSSRGKIYNYIHSLLLHHSIHFYFSSSTLLFFSNIYFIILITFHSSLTFSLLWML
ncbi:hypothetical protein Lalb_Chr07g0179151 [Lupinus albus]|uniref:Uncharacterized protein n=1 Tax=Lupinus albus TaxID=3870 RepID=A0A6A4Q7L0_LUPAL|nr:hypothetical protein Lalb_Chr07g0179151 [Lupinus albus]